MQLLPMQLQSVRQRAAGWTDRIAGAAATGVILAVAPNRQQNAAPGSIATAGQATKHL
ncbi:hypothetical protein J2792_002797 [Novosphingobium capsulatum]|uniref:Uncharacterized protein n=2 Tax=Novosphingobium capsulatum TaxID=13688 RepID=A0ABU1MNM2_9SPHN|nr:hypothetical protein [Novosphingobium capsulatum]